MTAQYGSGAPVREVDIGTIDQPQKMRIWSNPAERKLLVRTSAAEEAGLVTMQTAIWGPSYSGQPVPIFEKAATLYFAEIGQANCSVSNPTKLTDSAYEFRYECAAPAPAKRQKRRQ